MEIDMANRDPNDLNNFLQVEFNDIFGEPTGTHSMDCVWRNSYKCFTCTKNNCYKLLTFLCGIITAFCWGCAFACASFEIIWCYSPFLRLIHICLNPFKKILAIYLGACMGPCIQTYALIFSRIHVTNSTGPAPKPLDAVGGKNEGVESF